MTWIEHDGYSETHQYVDGRGQIIGEVHGSRFEREDGWSAFDTIFNPSVWLGRYVKLEDAKDAIEAHAERSAKAKSKAESEVAEGK